MPIVPPFPIRLFDALNSVIQQLRVHAEQNPDQAPTEALPHLEHALSQVEAHRIVPPFPIRISQTLSATVEELKEYADQNADQPVYAETLADLERALSRLDLKSSETT